MKTKILALLAIGLLTSVAKADQFDDFIARQRHEHLAEAGAIVASLAKRLHVQSSDIAFDESANEFNVEGLNCYNLSTSFAWRQIACRPTNDHTAFGTIVIDATAMDKILKSAYRH